jgi:RND family efflux transporter MFP subunit
MMRKRATIYSASATVLAIFAGMALSPSPAAGAPTVAVCRPGEFDSSEHTFSGRIEPGDRIEIRAPASGIVKSVAARPGTTVHKGDVLFECEWTSDSAGLVAAEISLREADEELKRKTATLAEARKLAEKGNEEIAKDYAHTLDELKDPLTKTHDKLLALLKTGLPPARRDAAQKLYGALERTLRLANARTGATLDVAYERQLAQVRPALAGILRFCTNPEKGSPEEQCAAELRSLQSKIDHLLLLSRARSKEGLDELAAERDVAEAALKNQQGFVASQKHETPPTRIAAPADSRVLRVTGRTGDRLEGSARDATLLCVLVPVSSVRVAFDIDEPTLELMHKLCRAAGQQKTLADVPVHIALPGETEFAYTGTLTFVDTHLDAKTRRVRCRATVDNAKPALLDAAFATNGKGERVHVKLTLGESAKVLLVPIQSVLTDAAGKSIVVVVDANNHIEYRQVKTGAEAGGLREVKEGLRATDWVVIGSPVSRKDGKGSTLEARDFVPDLRSRDLKPGITVEILAVPLPETESTARPKP